MGWGHIYPNTIPKALLPFFFGSAKRTIYSLKIHKPKKRKKEEKRKEKKRKEKKKTREQTEEEKKRVGNVQKKSKRKANYIVESCIGSFWLITLGFLEIVSS